MGYDESPASTLALCWAVEEARLRKSSVLVCHAWHWPYPLRPVEQEVLAQIERVAAHVVDEGVRRARSLAPDMDVRPRLARGTASTVLLQAAREAELTVLGSRGQGGFDDLQVGSAAVQVPAHSVGPVVVIRPDGKPAGDGIRIVVGIDGSPASLAAFGFALEEAALRGGAVTAICCWRDYGPLAGPEWQPFVDFPAIRRGAEVRFRDVTSHLTSRHPKVSVTTEFVAERPQRALIDATKDAMLLVLGNRGTDSPPCLLLGPVTQTALAEARCPVAVTPPS
ncbi:universal stress protein [Nonomuraea basaltis]|uniref:universal stress protein n=1 Tax=Nonomuraea basaltis TaxID=2495887 RepID=UPI001F0EA5A4|nr:universal stress protein [Nonomuraea basaltis]